MHAKMKKPEDNKNEFAEFMWMAEEGEDEVERQVEEELELIEQDFLEAMFEQLLQEEEENESYYGPPDHEALFRGAVGSTCNMELPVIKSNLNPNAPEFVPRFVSSLSS